MKILVPIPAPPSLVALGLLFGSSAAQAAPFQAAQLSGPLQSAGNVMDYLVSSDGARAVYLADQDTNDVTELYAVDLRRFGDPVKLSPALVSGGDVASARGTSPAISPDSRCVVYVADQELDERFELFSVALHGDNLVRLNPSLVAGGDVSVQFRISPDSSRVVYRADQETNGVFQLYSVPIDGSSAPVVLNGALVTGGDVSLVFAISADGTRVVYRADQEKNSVFELFSAPIDGSASPVKLNPSLAANGTVVSFQIPPASTRVVYLADQDQGGVRELYSVLITGGVSVRLNGALVAGGDVLEYFTSPDSARVVYRANQDVPAVEELYSAPIDGSTGAVKLNPPLVAGGNVRALDTRISPDSARVLYIADQDTDEVAELYSVPIDASSTAVRLNAPLAGAGLLVGLTPITTDSTRVLYMAEQDVAGVAELYSAPIDGSGSPIRLNPALVSGGDVTNYLLEPSGRRVVYFADQEMDGRYELFAAPVGGGQPATHVSGMRTSTMGFSRDGNRVFFLGQRTVHDELYVSYLVPPYRKSP